MPFVDNTNNRVLAANARAADVAEKAVKEIMPVMQQRYYDAFRVQGIEVIHYNRLSTGRKCNCKTAQKHINGLLGKDGKADIGTINALITGNTNFGVSPYNFNQQKVTGQSNQTSPQAPVDKYQGVFDILSDNQELPLADLLGERKSGFGDNGPVDATNIDEMVADFDASAFGFVDVACPICFGTGYVGGYTPFHGHRQVLTVADFQIDPTGRLDLTKSPFVAYAKSFNVLIKLPRGAIGVDAFRVLNMTEPVGAVFAIDGATLASTMQILNYCDGKQHLLSVSNLTEFTHLEMQFNLSTESVYFEFPKRPSSANTALLEQTEPFSIILSPNIPTMESRDIIVEQMLGKILVVQNVNPWNSRDRNVIGWEAMVRVIQPQELYRILPGRGRTKLKDETTNIARDNGYKSIYRT
jgi:hypothetical protein